LAFSLIVFYQILLSIGETFLAPTFLPLLLTLLLLLLHPKFPMNAKDELSSNPFTILQWFMVEIREGLR